MKGEHVVVALLSVQFCTFVSIFALIKFWNEPYPEFVEGVRVVCVCGAFASAIALAAFVVAMGL